MLLNIKINYTCEVIRLRRFLFILNVIKSESQNYITDLPRKIIYT